jgi:hypothetical protein
VERIGGGFERANQWGIKGKRLYIRSWAVCELCVVCCVLCVVCCVLCESYQRRETTRKKITCCHICYVEVYNTLRFPVFYPPISWFSLSSRFFCIAHFHFCKPEFYFSAWLVSLGGGVLPVWCVEPPLLWIPPKGRCRVLDPSRVVSMIVSVMLNLQLASSHQNFDTVYCPRLQIQ